MLTPAESLEGRWAPSRQALGAGFGAMARWPITPEGRAAQTELVADGLCVVEPIPFLAVLDEMRTIEIGEDEVVMHFDNSGDHVVRTIHMKSEHPADVQPSRHGHSIGWWEGDTLVTDTIAYESNPSGLGGNVPSSPGKHTVERLTLTEDRLRLRYEITVEDPVYLSEPAALAQQWDHRPDLDYYAAVGGVRRRRRGPVSRSRTGVSVRGTCPLLGRICPFKVRLRPAEFGQNPTFRRSSELKL